MSATSAALPAASAPASARALFVRRTYGHVALAILAFAALEWLLLRWDGARDLARGMTGGYNWLLVLLAFGVVSSLADRWTRSATSVGRQYLDLGLFVAAEAVLFLLLLLGASSGDGEVIPIAGLLTLLLVAGLTAVVALTRTDFSYLRTGLVVGGFLALGAIVASILFGFTLSLGFSLLMVGFASAAILYHTSTILRAYRTDQHVAAALALFGSVALLFWYVVQIVNTHRR